MKPGIDYTGISTSFFCHDGRGNFLLGKRSEKCRDEQGCWEVGGGKLEFGEDPKNGVLREVFEEYGCRGVIEEQLPPHSMVREHEGQKTHWLAIPFVVRIDPSEVKIGDPESIDEITWARLGNFPEPLHTGVKGFLQTHRHNLEKYSL